FDSINRYDFIEWLELHGSKRATEAPFVRAGYASIFAVGQPLAAGAALSSGIRLFTTYRDTYGFGRRMSAGMGDIVFAPLYLLLRERGVTFEFFHKVTRLEPAADHGRPRIEAIHMEIQARPKPGRTFDPIVWIKGMPCWPKSLSTARAARNGRPAISPLCDDLENGDALKAGEMAGRSVESFHNPPDAVESGALELGDGDIVVLGIPIGAFRVICADLIKGNRRWQEAVESSATLPTQAFQLWLTKSASDMGWIDEDPPQPPFMTAYEEPFDTYADFSQVLPAEAWDDGMVLQAAYFANAIMSKADEITAPDPELPARQRKEVRQAAIDFLKKHGKPMWSKALANDTFDWACIVDDENREGESRFDSQHYVANVEPSDRYVLSPPGSIDGRLDPGESGFANLYLAGDWTYNVISNVGFVEGAVVSGIQAAHAICRDLGCPGNGPRYVLGALGRKLMLDEVNTRRIRHTVVD
ncbi:MAG: hypothetical protein ACRD09_13915, partial [Vicinamibacterales bacterium]